MEVRISLTLPRDEQSVSLVRATCARALDALGVAQTCIDELQLVVSEACANVMQHSRADEEYEVVVVVGDHTCRLEVVDHGRGFDFAGAGLVAPDADSEGGRGISLIRALVDRLHFESRPGQGTTVTMVKSLDYERDAPLVSLQDNTDGTGG